MGNSMLLTADRRTHLKIVLVSLALGTLVAGVGVASRISNESAPPYLEATVIKVGKPVTASVTEDRVVR